MTFRFTCEGDPPGRHPVAEFLRRLRRFFFRLWRPYHCPECRRPYRKLTTADLGPSLATEYRRVGADLDFDAHAYGCDGCGQTVMIFP